jgi:nucleoside-diphosphate-sugar epimerase
MESITGYVEAFPFPARARWHALLTGPIAITGASGHVGTALRRRLASLPNDVRALERGDDLRESFRDAAVVVHLAGTLSPEHGDSYEEANLRTVERTLAALEGSTVERVVFLSYLGASPSSGNEYLRAKGLAEQLLYRCGRDVVVFRCSHIYGPPDEPGPLAAALTAHDGDGVVCVLGDGRQRIAPLNREDVVEAIVNASLDPTTYHGRFDLTGPDEMTIDDFVQALNGGHASMRHIPPHLARVLAHVAPGLTPAFVDVMLADSVGDPLRAARAYGLELRRVEDVYAASPHSSKAPSASA